MMSRTSSVLIRLLGLLILAGLLAGGGVMLFQAGQAQGFRLAQSYSAANEGAPSVAPLIPPMHGYRSADMFYARPFHRPLFGGFFGLIFGVALFFFALRLLFGPRHWVHPNMAGPNPGWHAHPHFWGTPPWMHTQPEAATDPAGEKKPTDPPAPES